MCLPAMSNTAREDGGQGETVSDINEDNCLIDSTRTVVNAIDVMT